MSRFSWLHAGAIAACLTAGAATAGPEEKPLLDLVDSRIRAWVQSPEVIEAVRSQNAAHTSISQAEIDRLDKQWRAETKESSRPLIDKVLASALSAHLRKLKEEGQGLYTEIFVMDNKGLNVGQSDVTSDYWQGDEAKWKETYLVGASAVHIGDIEQDESTQMFQAQVSVPVVDPDTSAPIGAVTVGVNVDEVMK